MGAENVRSTSMEAMTPWRISIYESTQTKSTNSLMCGELVYIKDPEFNSNLTFSCIQWTQTRS